MLSTEILEVLWKGKEKNMKDWSQKFSAVITSLERQMLKALPIIKNDLKLQPSIF